MWNGAEKIEGGNGMRKAIGGLATAGLLAVAGLAAPATIPAAMAQNQQQNQQQQVCSAWLMESSRFMHVPFGAFMPDRDYIVGSDNPKHNIPMVDLPVNIGVIKCGNE